MYGTEINIKITDFDDHDEIEEIITWLTYMVKKSKLKELQEKEEREARRSISRSKRSTSQLLSLDTIEEETIGGEDLTEKKEIQQEIKTTEAPRIKCECGVDYVAKNKCRHEKTKGHLKYLEQK